MTVSELIEQLKQFPPDLLVLKRRYEGNQHFRWESMDGHWFQRVEVVPSENPLRAGDYYEAPSSVRYPVEALEI